jgi:hypothetical protein
MKASTTTDTSRSEVGATGKLLITIASIGATLLGWLALGASDAPKTGTTEPRRPGTTPSPLPMPTLASAPEPTVRFVPSWQRAAARPAPVATTRSSR